MNILTLPITQLNTVVACLTSDKVRIRILVVPNPELLYQLFTISKLSGDRRYMYILSQPVINFQIAKTLFIANLSCIYFGCHLYALHVLIKCIQENFSTKSFSASVIMSFRMIEHFQRIEIIIQQILQLWSYQQNPSSRNFLFYLKKIVF